VDIHARSHVYSIVMSTGPPHPIPENQRAFPIGGDTPLLFAARGGDLASARLLLDAGANANDADAWGMSALAMAAYWDHDEIAVLLLENGRSRGRAVANPR
jgi:ankyrin repeat protein